jgi:O-methyltransferase involved in polyketide biosynthesis
LLQGGVFKNSLEQGLDVFAVDEEQSPDLPATFVPAQFASEALATTLRRSTFDEQKASLFIWLGGAGFRTAEAVVAALAFIASLPKGSSVVLDYAVEHTSVGAVAHTALDALASRIRLAGGIKHLIHPQAVAVMLRGLGFSEVLDLVQEELPITSGHLVSAVV